MGTTTHSRELSTCKSNIHTFCIHEINSSKYIFSRLAIVMKSAHEFKRSTEGQRFLLHLLDCLFALPNSYGNKILPKCKSVPSRIACYDLIVEMVRGSFSNYSLLHSRLMGQHAPESHKPYPWEYWPIDDCRADCGYVGLTNLGATCYLATCMQQLYMIPEARSCILKVGYAAMTMLVLPFTLGL